MKKLIVFSFVLFLIKANAQEGYNPNSLRPVHQSDIMYKKSVLRALDLREKQNKPMFSPNMEITRLLMEAVQAGKITAYKNDSLDQVLNKEQVNNTILIPSEDDPSDTTTLYIKYGDNWRDFLEPPKYYFARDLYQMELKEDIIFDKQRSKMYYDIQALTIFIPADHPENVRGIQIPVASFSYKELCEKLFKDNPKALAFNTENDAQHKNLQDAFDLRLFSAYIIKVSNADNAYLSDIYGGDQQKGIMASQWAAHDLLEYEHNLWEF